MQADWRASAAGANATGADEWRGIQRMMNGGACRALSGARRPGAAADERRRIRPRRAPDAAGTREIAIRISLRARLHDVVTSLLRGAPAPVADGALLGAAGARAWRRC